MNDTFVLGIGHPRTGTGYTADLLRKNGLDVGHESVGSNGMVSWLAAANRNDYPWGEKISMRDRNRSLLFLVARSPIDSIQSVMGENLNVESISWRRKVIQEYFNKDIYSPEVCNQDPVGIAIACMYYWYSMCLDQNPWFVFRVDRDDFNLLENNLSISIIEKNNIFRNSKPDRHEETPFVFENLLSIRKEWIIRLAEISHMLGYPEDVERLFDIY